MMIHPEVRLKYDPTEGAPEGTCLGRTPSGWIDSATFYEWIANHFEPFLQSNGIKKPALLLVDGHTSHINLDTSDICNAHDIILYCLPPHATLILQPLDVSVFKGLKSRWFAAVRNFQSLHVGEFVSKSKFAGVFSQAWDVPALAANTIRGFQKCRIFPFTKKYDTSKIAPSSIYQIPSDSSSLSLHL